MEFSKDELFILSNALNSICNGSSGHIEDWEFQTLIGCEREDAQNLLNKIGIGLN